MNRQRIAAAAAAVLFAAVGPLGLAKTDRSRINVPGHGELAIAGPFTHENLAIYVLISTARAPRPQPQYITLEEGIAAGLVAVREGQRQRVETLLVDNKSDKPLFLQAGELVKGGKQDRTLRASLIIPPKTTGAEIPTFCVERSRWSGGAAFAGQGMIMPGNRNAANVLWGDQRVVWEGVRQYKGSANTAVARAAAAEVRASKTSSINEELSGGEFGKLIDGYESKLKGAISKFDAAIGLAYAVNGQLSTVDIYHAATLFAKMAPKLLKSAAADAAANPPDGKTPPAPTAKDVADLLASAFDGQRHEQKLGFGNVFIRIVGSSTLTSQLLYKSELIHSRVLSKPLITVRAEVGVDPNNTYIGPPVSRDTGSSLRRPGIEADEFLHGPLQPATQPARRPRPQQGDR